tara:strand:+ start:7604 stop:8632 length:1029 start_codon:yes stop_codon:yes gene_type:complete
MAISNDLLSSTLFSILKKEVDQLYQTTPFLDFAKEMNGIEYEDGGIKIQRPLSLEEHSTITQFATGYEGLNLAVKDPMRPAIYDWVDFAAPIVITKKESTENRGEKGIVKILGARTRSVTGMLRREINKQIIRGNSSVLTQLNTLNGAVGGFLEVENANGVNQTNVIGGISKATYNQTTGWQNQFVDILGVFGTNGIRLMKAARNRANKRAPISEVNLLLMSEDAGANYERALFAQERFIKESELNGGRKVRMFGNAVFEEELELGFTATSVDSGGGAKPVSGYGINFGGIRTVFHEEGEFAAAPFETISGTMAQVSTIYLKMQVVADHLGSQFVLFDGDGY